MPHDTAFTKIHRELLDRYNLDELRTLCAEISVPFDDLGGEGRGGKARELILWLNRRGQLAKLTTVLESARVSQSDPEVQSPSEVDLAIVTAMPEELEPVLALIGGRERWEQFLLDKFVHYRTQFGFEGFTLNVVACSLWKYGGNPTTAQVLRLKALQPRLIAMTGICAGWESKNIHFGDVIVADRAFHAGEGKQGVHGFEPDLRTYQPPPWLMQWLNDFSYDKQWANTIQMPRPRSLRYQAEWMLCQMAERDTPFPTTDADWRKLKTNRIDVASVKKVLLDNGLVSEPGAVTERGMAELNTIKQRNNGKLAPISDPKQPAAHYGAFASTEAVIAVENPFLEHAQRIRKVRAIELEVASLFAAAAEIGVPAFAVKGVSDYGTPEKDDAFHEYAAEASARWMYAFIQRYGKLLLSI